jgi:hypothetical protein
MAVALFHIRFPWPFHGRAQSRKSQLRTVNGILKRLGDPQPTRFRYFYRDYPSSLLRFRDSHGIIHRQSRIIMCIARSCRSPAFDEGEVYALAKSGFYAVDARIPGVFI